MKNGLWFVSAAALEIAGCYCAWMWLRLERNASWMIPGTASLILFALVLTRVDAAFAGRAFAAYGGVYIVCALSWLALVERSLPRLTDLLGASLCLAGAAVIMFGARGVTG